MLLQVLFYVDPGSGSFLFQLLIGGFLAVAFFFRLARTKIQIFFKKLFSKKNDNNENES